MEVDITASLKTLITVCFWMNNDYVKPKGELLPVVATRTNYEWCKYKILIFQTQVAIKIENKPSRAIPAENSRQQVNLTHHSMESTFVLLQKVEMFCKKSQKRLWHQGKCGRMRRIWTQFYNQSPTKNNLRPRRQSSSIFQIPVQIFFTIHTIDDPSYSTDTLGLNEWISPVWTKISPVCISKAPKNKHMPRVFDLTKNRFQKNEKIPQEKSFERNGTFFLLLRRFFKLPNLDFPLHGCNLTNFFLE